MSVRNLKALLQPRSIAVVGASTRPRSVGAVVMRNLLQAGFGGPVMPVTAEHASVAGVLAYADVAGLPAAPDLALICTPADTVAGIVRALGERGTRAACIMSAAPPDGRAAIEAALAEARGCGMRVLGPASMGLLVPALGLNASFAPEAALPGKVAFVSQSGTVCSAVLDWAGAKNIGFSTFLHIGKGADVGFGDILDYLGSDPGTRAILLYLESIGSRRDFMSAARAAARNKPVLLIKGGRTGEGSDAVFDAAIRRAGMLRVRDIEEIFGAVETLARLRPVKGRRLAILTNGRGLAMLSADDLAEGGGDLAELPPETLARLDAVLPPGWSRGNPVVTACDADADRYAKALTVLLECKGIDAVLVMYAPSGLSDPAEVAEAVISVAKERPRANIMTCWVGSARVAEARHLFAEAAMPTFDTPRAAVEGFLHVQEYRRNQDMLMEVPASAQLEFVPDTRFARSLVRDALAAGKTTLAEPEAMALLRTYGIPVIETHVAASPAEAARIAAGMGGSVALKIVSPDVIHKSDVGGVVLNLSPPAVEAAATAMLGRVAAIFPQARIDGFTVQRMASRRPGTQELMVGVITDPVFGPAITFGQGGVGSDVIADHAVALPPLNSRLAADLIERTRVSRLLRGYHDRPPADIDALHLTLIQVAQMTVDLPEVVEMTINPLRCDSQGVMALDARIRLAPAFTSAPRLAIRPYPADLEEWFTMADGRRVLLRPIRPEDEPNHHVFISRLTTEDIRFRFFGLVHELPHSEMARLTQIDYDREMAFIAEIILPDGEAETLGVVRTITDPDNEKAEFAIVVRSDLKGSGLGKRLLTKMIHYCRVRGTRAIVGQILKDNFRMLRFVEHLGFRPMRTVDDDIVEVELELTGKP